MNILKKFFYYALLIHLCPVNVSAQDELEKIFWESVACSDKAQVEAYLEQFPSGAFISEAEKCLAGETEQPDSKINNILADCHQLLLSDRLATGGGDTALNCYQRVLDMDPANEQAVKGLIEVQQRYVSLVQIDISEGRFEQAQENLDILTSLNSQHPSIQQLNELLVEAKQQTQQEAMEAKVLKVLVLPWRDQGTSGHEKKAALEGLRRAFDSLSGLKVSVAFSTDVDPGQKIQIWIPQKTGRYWSEIRGTMGGPSRNRRLGAPKISRVRELGQQHNVDIVLMISMLKSWSGEGEAKYDIEAHAIDVKLGTSRNSANLGLLNLGANNFAEIVVDVLEQISDEISHSSTESSDREDLEKTEEIIYSEWRGSTRNLLGHTYDVVVDLQENNVSFEYGPFESGNNAGQSCSGVWQPRKDLQNAEVGDALLFKETLQEGPCLRGGTIKLEWVSRDRIVYSWFKVFLPGSQGELLRAE